MPEVQSQQRPDASPFHQQGSRSLLTGWLGVTKEHSFPISLPLDPVILSDIRKLTIAQFRGDFPCPVLTASPLRHCEKDREP